MGQTSDRASAPVSERHWVKSYPKEVPPEIDPDKYLSILQVFHSACDKFGNRPCYSNMGVTLTFEQLRTLSGQFAAFLRRDLGLSKGDRIGLQMPNVLQYPVAMFGAMRAGLVVVNTNPLYTPREMEHQFKDAGVKAIVILANFAHNLQKILAKTDIKHVIITEIGDLLGFPKKLIVNSVVKYVKKMVPAYNLPKAI